MIALLLISVVLQPSNSVEKCGQNEIFNTCGSSCIKTCDTPELDPIFCTKDCVPGCFCADGFVKDLVSNKCISLAKCPKATQSECYKKDVNSEFTTCIGCPSTCKNWLQPSICPAKCREGCKCKQGYHLDNTGKCVLLWNCFLMDFPTLLEILDDDVNFDVNFIPDIVPKFNFSFNGIVNE